MDIYQCEFCCGLQEFGRFPVGNTEKEIKEDYYSYLNHPNAYECWNNRYNDIVEELIEYFCEEGQVFCTISMKDQRWMYELLLAVGFEEVKRWKSNHGDYDLVMFIN